MSHEFFEMDFAEKTAGGQRVFAIVRRSRRIDNARYIRGHGIAERGIRDRRTPGRSSNWFHGSDRQFDRIVCEPRRASKLKPAGRAG